MSSHIIDLFPEFASFWQAVGHLPASEVLDRWVSAYMASYQDLWQLQVSDYATYPTDWQVVAKERVLPYLNERLADMMRAHQILLACSAPLVDRASRLWQIDEDVFIVLYVGIGCGAGWVTRFQDHHALLFGLEGVAENGWLDELTLAGLVAHETGHLVEQHLRMRARIEDGSGPYWQLFDEGFAQRVEHILTGAESWHEARQQGDWLEWCKRNRQQLAALFLEQARRGEGVKEFFGSWFQVDGRRQTGYYLGHEVIRELEKRAPLNQIAQLPPKIIDEAVSTVLESWVTR